MATKLTKTEWIEILHDRELTRDKNLEMFQVMYSFDKQAAPASQIGKILGHSGKKTDGPISLEMGRYARRIEKKHQITFNKGDKGEDILYELFFNGWHVGTLFFWQLREELVEAIEETGLSEDRIFPEKIPVDEQEKLFEGAKRTLIVNSYERNSKARQRCLEANGLICKVCDFDFEKNYGELGKGYINVHHIIPIHKVGKNYEVDPINDLQPVCPNCHSMLHRIEPPLQIEELKSIMKLI